MKSAHKLGTALGLFILLSVAAYFIITGFQQAGTKPPAPAPATGRADSNKTIISDREQVATSAVLTPNEITDPAASSPTSSTASSTPGVTPPSSTTTSEPTTTTITTTPTTTTSTTEAPTTTPSEPASSGERAESTTTTTTTTNTSPNTDESTNVITTTTQAPASVDSITTTKRPDSQEAEELVSTIKMYEEATRLPPVPVELSPEEFERWTQFKAQYRRAYGSQAEEDARRAIFIGNLRFINAFNRRSGASYTLDVNHFTDFTRDETNRLFIGPRRNWTQTNSPSMRILSDGDPSGQPVKSVDWRHLMSDGGPMDQGSCMDSAIFALVASLESTINAAGGPTKTKLSEQQLIDCVMMNWPPEKGRVCSGQLSLVDILSVLEKNHVKLSTFGEYIQFKQSVAAGQAPPNQCVPPAASLPDMRPYVPSHVSVACDNIDEALHNSGPLVVALDASQPTFHFYKSGVYHELECSSDSHNYYALLVALTAPEPAGSELGARPSATYTIRASLGHSWGEAGHMRLASDPHRNKCLPQEAAIYPNIGFE